MRESNCEKELVSAEEFKAKIGKVDAILETISAELIENPIAIYNDPSVMIKEIESSIAKIREEMAQTKQELINALSSNLFNEVTEKNQQLQRKDESIKKFSQKIESISADASTKSLSHMASLEDILSAIIKKSDHKAFEGK